MLVSIDGTAVLRSVDRTFGGKGEAPSPLPDAFTPSVGLMVRRMTGLVCTALTQALAFGEGEAVRTLRSDSRLSDLEAFAADTQLATVDLTVEEPGQAQWTIRLATPVSTLAALCAEPADSQRPVGPADPAAQPWCDLPLTVSAVLVEMRLPVSALAGLCPDALLPVSVARQVPLRIAGTRFAHGTIGSLDDCVAIQITQAF
jgi:flagellar motor switch protein FliM